MTSCTFVIYSPTIGGDGTPGGRAGEGRDHRGYIQTESAARSSCLLGYTFVHNDSITVLCIKLSPPMSSSL